MKLVLYKFIRIFKRAFMNELDVIQLIRNKDCNVLSKKQKVNEYIISDYFINESIPNEIFYKLIIHLLSHTIPTQIKNQSHEKVLLFTLSEIALFLHQPDVYLNAKPETRLVFALSLEFYLDNGKLPDLDRNTQYTSIIKLIKHEEYNEKK